MTRIRDAWAVLLGRKKAVPLDASWVSWTGGGIAQPDPGTFWVGPSTWPSTSSPLPAPPYTYTCSSNTAVK